MIAEGAQLGRHGGRSGLSHGALKLLVCGILIAGAVIYLVSAAMGSTMVYYVTVPELRSGTGAAARDQVRLAGFVVGDTIERQGNNLRFEVSDLTTGERIPVAYSGVIPDIFGDGIEVIVDGRYARDAGRFEAQTLLAKCPSRFEGEDPAMAPHAVES